MPVSFGSKLQRAFDNFGQLCVGVDPHASLLDDWGLSDSVSGLESFANSVLEAAVGSVGIIKPQVSFFERFGSAGFKVLEDLCERAATAGVVNIMDVKRGDIGTTMDAYFDAWLDKSAPFICDAITVSPYLGFNSLKPIMSRASELGKGVIVLAATSNPEGASLQQAQNNNDESIAFSIWNSLSEVNALTAGAGDRLGSFGAVIGATLNLNKFGLQSVSANAQKVATPILAPGFGAQGARLLDAGRLFGSASSQLIASVSRSVIATPNVSDAIEQAKAELAEGLA